MIRRFFKLFNNGAKPSNEAQIEMLAGEVRSGVEQAEQYGFTSNTPSEVNEGLCVFTNGQSDNAVIVGYFDKQFRPITLESGEVAVYHKTGSIFIMKNNGDIEMTPISGNLKLNGVLIADNAILNGIDMLGHGHIENIPVATRTQGGAIS